MSIRWSTFGWRSVRGSRISRRGASRRCGRRRVHHLLHRHEGRAAGGGVVGLTGLAVAASFAAAAVPAPAPAEAPAVGHPRVPVQRVLGGADEAVRALADDRLDRVPRVHLERQPAHHVLLELERLAVARRRRRLALRSARRTPLSAAPASRRSRRPSRRRRRRRARSTPRRQRRRRLRRRRRRRRRCWWWGQWRAAARRRRRRGCICGRRALVALVARADQFAAHDQSCAVHGESGSDGSESRELARRAPTTRSARRPRRTWRSGARQSGPCGGVCIVGGCARASGRVEAEAPS